jgi:hypothetical protein
MSTAPHTHTDVDVLLTACDQHDAEAVLDALNASFEATSEAPPAGAPSTPPPPLPEDRHTVWSLCVNTRVHHEGGGSFPLHDAVTADLSGGPYYVRGVREALKDAFLVEEQGHVSGDEEVELRLRLTAPGRTRA